jgi:hypothetical protein
MSLEKTYKKSSSFLSQCSNTFISLLKIFVRSKPGLKLPQTDQKTCIILGNGPSLNDSLKKHPDFLNKHSLICVNAFSLSDEFVKLQPEYYVILDPSFWVGTNDFFSGVMNGIAKKTTWKLHLLIPYSARSSRFLSVIEENKNIQIHYFNYTVFKGFTSVANWFYKKNLAMPQSQNVLVASIFLSVNIGFKEIYILGADHTWHESLHVNDDNILCIKDVHFYENGTEIRYKPFFSSVEKNKTHRVDEIFAIWAKTFYGYIAVNNYASHRKAVIYNASEVSFIDAFKRVKLK